MLGEVNAMLYADMREVNIIRGGFKFEVQHD